VRDEAYYFAPQAQTKIMNEGWASYWHSTIMTTRRSKITRSSTTPTTTRHDGHPAGQAEPLQARHRAVPRHRRPLEQGPHGKEWEECDDLRSRRAWDKKLGAGREKIFEVRKHYNDVTFIDEFLTPEFAIEQKLFVFNFNDKKNSWEIATREFKKVKAKLLQSLTNFGQPVIDVIDANLDNRGELMLSHRYLDGVDLDPAGVAAHAGR
jgi:stage V sporulation protein R